MQFAKANVTMLFRIVLSDGIMKGEIAKMRMVIEPFGPVCIQPASADTHRDKKLPVFRTWQRLSLTLYYKMAVD